MKKGFLPFRVLLVITMLAIGLKSLAGSDGHTAQLPDHDKAYAAEQYLSSLRANQHSGFVNPADEINARHDAMLLASSRGENNLSWTSVGPDNFGGKTTAVFYDNQDETATTIFAAALGGGVWRSLNNGITWKSVGDLGIHASSMVQTDDGTLYVGTGDGKAAFTANYNGLENLNYSTSFMGTGIYKSTDGENFSQLPATAPTFNDNESNWAFVYALDVTPNSGRIYAATNSGLRYTSDGGDTWTMAKDVDGNDLSGRVTNVKIGADGAILAAMESELYISKTGSASNFVNRSTADSVSLPNAGVFMVDIAISPSDPATMYAMLIQQNGRHNGIYRSTDHGDTWKVILPSSAAMNILSQRGTSNSFIEVFPENPDRIIVGGLNLWEGRKVLDDDGFFAWAQRSRSNTLQIDPMNLHAGQQALSFRPGSSNEFVAGTDGGVYKGMVNSTDFTFQTSNRNFINTQFYSVAMSGGENEVIGGAQSHGIIYISGTGNTNRYGKEIMYQGPSFIGGAPTHGSAVAFSTINPEAIVMGAPGGFLYRSEDLAFTVSAQFFKDTAHMSNTTNVLRYANSFKSPIALWESYDDLKSRDSVMFYALKDYEGGDVIKAASANNSHPFYYTLPNNVSIPAGDSLLIPDRVSSKLFVSAQDRVWMTREVLRFDKRPEWYLITDIDQGFSGMPNAIAYSKDADHLFIGTLNGKLYRISNIADAYNYHLADVWGEDYMITTTPIPVYHPNTDEEISQAITSIAVDPNDPNNVVITLANYGNAHYVFMSDNALDDEPEFVSKQGNLPAMPVYASVIEMSNPEMVMVGTDRGLFVTDDITSSSPSWSADYGSMGSLPVFDLKQQWISKTPDTVQLINVDTLVLHYPGTNNYGIIYAATFGRGIYRTNDFRIPVGLDEKPAEIASQQLNIQLYPNPVRHLANVRFDLNERAEVGYRLFDLHGRMLQSETMGMRMAGPQQLQIDASQLKAGTYLIHLQAGDQSGTQKFMVY